MGVDYLLIVDGRRGEHFQFILLLEEQNEKVYAILYAFLFPPTKDTVQGV